MRLKRLVMLCACARQAADTGARRVELAAFLASRVGEYANQVLKGRAQQIELPAAWLMRGYALPAVSGRRA